MQDKRKVAEGLRQEISDRCCADQCKPGCFLPGKLSDRRRLQGIMLTLHPLALELTTFYPTIFLYQRQTTEQFLNPLECSSACPHPSLQTRPQSLQGNRIKQSLRLPEPTDYQLAADIRRPRLC